MIELLQLSSCTRYCHLIESYTFSIIHKIKANLKPKELKDLSNDSYPCLIPDSTRAKGNKGNRCMECMPCSYWNVISYFNQKTIDALVRCTRFSLDFLRKAMQSVSRYNTSEDVVNSSRPRGAFFFADIILELPQIVLKPSLDDIQQNLNKAVQVILKTTQNMYEWRHHKLLHLIMQPVIDDNTKVGSE